MGLYTAEELKDIGEALDITDIINEADNVTIEKTASEPDPADVKRQIKKTQPVETDEEADGQMNIAPGF